MRGVERLYILVRLIGDESIARRSSRDLVLTRLVEVLLIEALRSTPGDDTPPGLLRALADPRIAPAMPQMHGQIARSWTMAQLAKKAVLSRSRFRRWNICWRGGWLWRKICCGGRRLGLRRLRSALGMGRRVRSVLRLVGMLGRRREGMRVRTRLVSTRVPGCRSHG